MSSSAWANFSNQTAALKGSLQEGQTQGAGMETENDRKAFMAETLQNVSQFGKEQLQEKLMDKTKRAALATATKNLLSGKGLTPLKDAADAAKTSLKSIQDNTDEAGIAESETLSTNTAATIEATTARDSAKTASDLAETAADTADTDAAEAVTKVTQATSNLAATQAATDASAAQSIAQGTVHDAAAAQQAIGEQAARVTAADAEQTTAAALKTSTAADFSTAARTAATAEATLSDASDVEQSAKAAIDVARAARLAKGLQDVKDTEAASEAADETGDPIAFAVTALSAIATAVIGSRIEVHKVVAPTAPNIAERASYGAVVGA
tara:strand:+ start:24 stop:998 length:975 start_codon:yes stop_codon:yes gene_type:complete